VRQCGPAREEPCVHRGEQVGLEPCPTCGPGKQIKIFACAVHGRCERAGKIAGVQFCGTCQAYAAASP
jgi:hypothetical protein